MRITAVSVLEYARPLDGHSWNPSFRWTERRAPLVVIEAGDGLAGVGEAWCRQPAIGLVLEHMAGTVAPQLLGIDVADPLAISIIAGRVRKMEAQGGEPWIAAAAASMIDMALWDLLAKSRAQPLWRALGGQFARVNVYASGGLYRDGDGEVELAVEMCGYIASGFRAVKMKVGALPLAADLQRVRAVREAIGPGIELWVDAVNQLDRATAMPWVTALAEAGATAIQAPVPSSDLDTMARINGECMPVVAGEAEYDGGRFKQMLAARAVTLLQPNLGLCGGFSGAAGIALSAQEWLIDVTPQTFGTAVLQAASLHWGAATAGVHSVEYHRFHNHLAPLLKPCMKTLAEGRVVLDETPGLGVDMPRPGPQTDGGDIRCVRRVASL